MFTHRSLVSRPLQWPRALLAALLLAFALNSIAHAAHRHDQNVSSASHSVACGYCFSFGGLADAPIRLAPILPLARSEQPQALVPDPIRTTPVRATAQPRAPPLFA